MIKPTVGRVVWFRPSSDSQDSSFVHHGDQPCAATIAFVFDDRLVNLSVLDHDGSQHSCTSVPLVQEGDPKPENGYYCEWMPYQLGQAAKTEALEKQLQEPAEAEPETEAGL